MVYKDSTLKKIHVYDRWMCNWVDAEEKQTYPDG